MSPLLSADALEIFQKNIGFFIFIVLLLVLFAVIQNFDKLSEPFGTKRRWEVETARLAANLKHWELQKYKQEHGFTQDDPFESSRGNDDVGRTGFSYYERLGYATLGAYLSLSSLYLYAYANPDRTPQLQPFEPLWSLFVFLALFALLSGLVTASLHKKLSRRLDIMLLGASESGVTLLVVAFTIVLFATFL